MKLEIDRFNNLHACYTRAIYIIDRSWATRQLPSNLDAQRRRIFQKIHKGPSEYREAKGFLDLYFPRKLIRRLSIRFGLRVRRNTLNTKFRIRILTI